MKTLGVTLAIVTLALTDTIITTLQPLFWYLAAAACGAALTAAIIWARQPVSPDTRFAQTHPARRNYPTNRRRAA